MKKVLIIAIWSLLAIIYARAQDNANTIDLSVTRTGNIIQTNWVYIHSQTKAEYTIKGNVTIIGTTTSNIPISFYIANNAVLTWQANLTGSYAYSLVSLRGNNGTTAIFEMTSGSIMQYGPGTAIESISSGILTINVNGGTVSAGIGRAIDTKGDINIKGGNIVSATNGNATAVIISSGNVTVTGGTVESTGKNGTAIYTLLSDFNVISVIINGGIVKATGEGGTAILSCGGNTTISGNGIVHAKVDGGTAINSLGKVLVLGGEVIATTGTAIYAGDYGGLVFINNGSRVTVAPTGTRVSLYYPLSYGLIIEKTNSGNSYSAGSDDGLDVTPVDATAVWTIENGQHGIRYTKSWNTGFIELPDVTVTGIKIDPVVTFPISATLTYGQSLAETELSGHENITPGIFTFTDLNSRPSVAQSGAMFEMTFTPTDLDIYNILTKDVSVMVSKAVPDYIIPTNLIATHGKLLSSVVLPDGWIWEDNTVIVGNVGTQIYKAKFIPVDTENFSVVAGIDLTVMVTTITSSEKNSPASPLRAWIENGLLHVNGLVPGKMWSVYNTSGRLVYRNIAGSENVDIPLINKGMYIILSGGNPIKVVSQ